LRKITSLLFVFLIGFHILSITTYASWAYPFVVYDENVYVVSETHIEPNNIGKKIGDVSKYSDLEGTYSGNFSNQFPKGTEYYEIKGLTAKEAIAIKESKESFIKAINNGKYAGSGEYEHKNHIMNHLLVYVIGVVLLFLIIYLFYKRRKK